MFDIVYCPVCGANIIKRKKCSGCGYESARDYELYPTLSPVSKDIKPISVKRNQRKKQRIQEIIEKQMQPKLDVLKQNTEVLEKKLLDMKNVAQRQIRQSVITIKDNTCTLGSYPQDADGTERPIQWKVLDIDLNKGKALLLSDQILDCRPYYAWYTDTNWAKTGVDSKGLRYWLNHDFYERAFSDEEKNVILLTNVMPHANPSPESNENQGNAVQDKIFLLSAEEVIRYFAKSKPKIGRRDNFVSLGGTQAAARGTEYAKKGTDLDVDKVNGNSRWWLRSVGSVGSFATNVLFNGNVLLGGNGVSNDYIGVRPALWVNLKS